MALNTPTPAEREQLMTFTTEIIDASKLQEGDVVLRRWNGRTDFEQVVGAEVVGPYGQTRVRWSPSRSVSTHGAVERVCKRLP